MSTLHARFDLRFYRGEAVVTAVEAFAPFGEFNTTDEENAILVSAEIDGSDQDRVWGEFQNYVLVNSYEVPNE